MNRANQEALFQATNQGLLQIRQSEINYYQSLNVAFGTQAALIGGFTYGVFSQNQINYENSYSNVDILADVYWICSAITIALSVHVILCTMLMQVLGPGLSLNGPVGSMARATEGMRLEQKQIIVAFVLMMIGFSISTVLSCWVVMSFEASIGCSISFAVAACYWYKYCERIYLRFYWEPDDSGWNARTNSFDAMNETEPSIPNPLHTTGIATGTVPTKLKTKQKRRGILSYLFQSELRRRKSTESHIGSEDGGRLGRATSEGSRTPGGDRTRSGSNPINTTTLKRTLTNSSYISDIGVHNNGVHTSIHGGGGVSNSNWASVSANRGIVMEGYLTKRGGNSQKVLDFRSEPWERRYFTLTNTSCLYIYKNRHEYRTNAKNPIYTRPLRLYEYYIEINNIDYDIRESTACSEIGEGTVTHKSLFAMNNITVPDDTDIKPFRFQIILILRENAEPVNDNAILSVNEQGVSHLTRAQSERVLRYRDHWVLRCDTEEELQQWVSIMHELCPSSFKNM